MQFYTWQTNIVAFPNDWKHFSDDKPSTPRAPPMIFANNTCDTQLGRSKAWLSHVGTSSRLRLQIKQDSNNQDEFKPKMMMQS